MMMTDDELIYGIQGVTYRGLLTQPDPTIPPPLGAMTRQRRRAEARAAAKRSQADRGVVEKSGTGRL